MRAILRLPDLKLRAKLTLLIEGIVIVIVVVTGIITTMREKESLENELHKRGLALANDLATFTARPLLNQDLATLRRFINHSIKQDYVRFVMILDPQGKVIMHSNLLEVGKTYQDSLAMAAINSKTPGCVHTHLLEGKELYCDIFAPSKFRRPGWERSG